MQPGVCHASRVEPSGLSSSRRSERVSDDRVESCGASEIVSDAKTRSLSILRYDRTRHGDRSLALRSKPRAQLAGRRARAAGFDWRVIAPQYANSTSASRTDRKCSDSATAARRTARNVASDRDDVAPRTSHRPATLLAYYGHHKCASTWLGDILARIMDEIASIKLLHLTCSRRLPLAVQDQGSAGSVRP